MKKSFLFVFIILSSLLKVDAQPIFPENGPLYIDTVVPRIDIAVNPDTLEWLYQEENLENDIEFHAVFVFNNGTVIDTIEPVGFRLRGNTSRYSNKKSFKISFNRFTKGGKYYGVEKLNLNGEHNDPSVIRSKIGWDIFRQFDIPAPRANHVEVYINNDYYGLYISVEHIDEEFVKSRFTYNNGNLYKCLWPANLNYLGNDPDLYKLEQGDRRVYDLKINEEADDYSDLARFIDILNNTPNEDLVCELNEVFNVYDYMKVIAIDIFLGHWDGYIYNQNNYYLYHNAISDKLEFIPYDVDNTLGIDWIGRDWGKRNIYDWQKHGDNYRPLYERLMNLPEFRDQYTYYSKQLIEKIDYDSLENAILARRDMIFPFITDDPYYPLDYGYTPSDFLNSYEQAIGGHVAYGLLPYIQTRRFNTSIQVENTQMDPVIKYIRHQRQSATKLWVNAYAEVGMIPETVEIKYKLDEGEFKYITMFDDGNHHDGEAGDLTFGGTIDYIPLNTSLSYQIKVTGGNSKATTLPCLPVFIPGSGGENPALFINEFMASNDKTIADEYGDYDDWIEVYSAEGESVWLGDKFLTDNLQLPNKWQMPDAYIQPGEFLLFWADDETDQGSFHTNFKLSKGGEEIGIFNNAGLSIDEYIFGEQETDISEGRFPNGTNNWVFFTSPTPRESNGFTAVDENRVDKLTLFPNPTIGGKVSFSKPTNYKIYNTMGILVEQHKNSQFFNTTHYNKGLYIVVIDSGQRLRLIVQ
jgi:hypothetical protein